MMDELSAVTKEILMGGPKVVSLARKLEELMVKMLDWLWAVNLAAMTAERMERLKDCS